jgi:hypothetical protein
MDDLKMSNDEILMTNQFPNPPHPPATVLQTLIINDLGCYRGATIWLICSTCSTLVSHPLRPLMATAAWRPESKRHLPRFYSTENSEEPNTKGNRAATCCSFLGFIISVTLGNKANEHDPSPSR